MSYLTSETNDSFISTLEKPNKGNQPNLILKMGLAELILHATMLLLLV